MLEQASGQQPRASRPAVAKQRKSSTARNRSSRSIPTLSSNALQTPEELEPLREASADVDLASSPSPTASSPSRQLKNFELAKRSLASGSATAASAGQRASRSAGPKTKSSEAPVGYRGVRGKRHPNREAARAAPKTEAATTGAAASIAAETGAASSSAAEITASGTAEAFLSETSGEKGSQKVSPTAKADSQDAPQRKQAARASRKVPAKTDASKKTAIARPQMTARMRAVTAGGAAEVAGLAEDGLPTAGEGEPGGEAAEPSGAIANSPGRVSPRERPAEPPALGDSAADILKDQVQKIADQEAEVSYEEKEEGGKQLRDAQSKEDMQASTLSPNNREQFQNATLHKLKVKGDSDPGVGRESERRCSLSSTGSTDFVFSFRFFNYNMGNKPEIQMDNIGAGFASRRSAKGSLEAEEDCAEQQASVAMALGDVDTKGLRETLGWGSSTGFWCGRRVPFEELLAAGVPGKNEASFRPSLAQAADSAPEADWKPAGATGMTGFMMRTASAIFKTRSSSTPTLSSRKPKQKKISKGAASPQKQKQLIDWLQSTDRSSAVCSVDCSFGVLSETRFSLSHLDGVAEDLGERALVKRVHAHNMSAVQTLAERGGLDGMKGKVAASIVGDLRTVVLCSSSLELVEDGKVFCPFDEANVMETSKLKSNPMKCFMGQTFDAACGALRFVFLGTHFPMQKITKLMADSAQDVEVLMPQFKSLVARTLRKILRHALLGGVLDGRTMLILQGDLNSRTVHANGRWFDLLYETLRDPMLQNFIAAELPMELQGEWREVTSPPDPGQLPVTYRFDTSSSQSVMEGCHLRLNQVYGSMGKEVDFADNDTSTEASTRLPSNWPSADSSLGGNTTPTTTPGTPTNSNSAFTLSPLLDTLKPYREIMDKLGSKAGEWGLFQQKGDGKEEKGKNQFKPGRLPSCTERVIYYAPAGLQQRTQWYSQRGYEVNYQQLGSDHKPVLMEATLRVGRCAPGGSPKRSSKVFNRWSLNSQDSDNSSRPPLSRDSSVEDLASEDSPQDKKPKPRGRARTSSPIKKGEAMLKRARTALRIGTPHGHFHDLL